MRRLLFIALAATLSACASNPADQAAQQAGKIPIIASYRFLSHSAHAVSTAPTHAQGYVSGSTDDMNPPLGKALLANGYARKVYLVSPADGFIPVSYSGILRQTAKGAAAGWRCKADDTGSYADCDIPIGHMEIGKAEIGNIMGEKVVTFDCTAKQDGAGGTLDGMPSTNWSQHVYQGTITWNHKAVCYWPVGPDSDIVTQ